MQIKGKLMEDPYRELREKYGQGILVASVQLWFAALTGQLYQSENAFDDFMTRTAVGLEDVRRMLPRRQGCPSRNVIVICPAVFGRVKSKIPRRVSRLRNEASLTCIRNWINFHSDTVRPAENPGSFGRPSG